MKLYVSIPALVAAGLLSACDSTNPAVVSQIDDAIGFVAALDAGQAEFENVAVDDLPDNATMNGYLAASNDGLEGGIIYVGDATADFNFLNSTLIGTASNFNEYELAEACIGGFEECTGEQTRALGGSLNLIGGTFDEDDGAETGFYYSAQGQLTGEDDDLGTLTANVFVGGQGSIVTLDDKLIAAAYGDGNLEAFDEDGYLTDVALDTFLVLQE
jgi:YD repeat-containing protein